MSRLALIFDFDGTLADTMQAYGRAWNAVAPGFGLKPITGDEIAMLQHRRPREIMRYLGLSALKLPVVASRLRTELNKDIRNLSSFPGLGQTLRRLKEQGRTLGILTSNSRANVEAFLHERDMALFDFIYSGSRIFGKSSLLRRVLKSHGLKPGEAAYVCDEVRDVEAARKVGLKVLAVSWGFNSPEALRREAPDALLQSAGDFFPVLSALEQTDPLP